MTPHPSPDPEIESLLASYFLPAPESLSAYELTLQRVADEMGVE
jgi:hypothetical protein